MSDKTYNGWSNYETWRVNLEILDGYAENDADEIEGYIGVDCAENDDVGGLAETLSEYVDEVLTGFGEADESASNFTLSYARSFVGEVNFREIARSMLDNWRENAACVAVQND